MSLKVLHLAAHLGPSDGIVAQMRWEQEAARTLRLPWTVRLVAPTGVYPPQSIISEVDVPGAKKHARGGPWSPIDWLVLRLAVVRWLRKNARDFDIVLLRYSPHDPFQYLWIRRSPVDTVIVSHTLELAELEVGSGLSNRIRVALERRLGPATRRRATGYVGVTNEILRHQLGDAPHPGQFAVVYPNGVESSGQPAIDRRGDIPEFLFVASKFAPWHGLDVLIELMADDPQPLRIHVVGELSPELRQQVDTDHRLIRHGNMSPDAIRDLAATCWLGLSAFALERKGMDEACALKVREYLALGLPVAAAYREVLPADFPYFRRVTPSLNELLAFAYSVRSVSRDDVRSAALPHVSKTALLEQLYEYLTQWKQPEASHLPGA